MRNRATAGILALTLVAAVSACDESDEGAVQEAPADVPMMQAPGNQQVPPEATGLIMEAQEVQAQLEPIVREALQDEELAARVEEVQSRVEAEMREMAPETMAQMDDLQSRIEASTGDPAEQQALMAEAQRMQSEMQALQTRVMQQPEIQSEIEELEADQRARMIEINPEAEALLERMDSLIAELQAQAPGMS